MKFGHFFQSCVPETAEYECVLVQLIDIQRFEKDSFMPYKQNSEKQPKLSFQMAIFAYFQPKPGILQSDYELEFHSFAMDIILYVYIIAKSL